MTTCRTCKHWGDGESRTISGVVGIGKCKVVPLLDDATEWVEDTLGRTLKPEFSKCLAFVQDASGYYAELLTLENFSCSQWEKKE